MWLFGSWKKSGDRWFVLPVSWVSSSVPHRFKADWVSSKSVTNRRSPVRCLGVASEVAVCRLGTCETSCLKLRLWYSPGGLTVTGHL